MKRRLLIVGASVRAATWSATCAGFEVVAADLFADVDLQDMCQTRLIPAQDYPESITSVAAETKAEAWMYTGCIENHPELVDQTEKLLPLWGNAGTALQAVRDPFALEAFFRKRGIPFPETLSADQRLPTCRRWLRKPFRSGSGTGVYSIASGIGSPARDASKSYLQQFVVGDSFSAVFVGAGQCATLLGVTRQWTNKDIDEHAWNVDMEPFRYLGSTGPIDLPGPICAQWQRIGSLLVEEFGVRGLFGVDAVVTCSADGASTTVWPVEVNPRYTASIETLERSLGWNSIALHAAACGAEVPTKTPGTMADRSKLPRHCGKRIMFARRGLVVDGKFLDTVATWHKNVFGYPRLVDIPCTGTKISKGRPIATILAAGDDVGELERQLGLTARSPLVETIVT